jgi:hypothetical protein
MNSRVVGADLCVRPGYTERKNDGLEILFYYTNFFEVHVLVSAE